MTYLVRKSSVPDPVLATGHTIAYKTDTTLALEEKFTA